MSGLRWLHLCLPVLLVVACTDPEKLPAGHSGGGDPPIGGTPDTDDTSGTDTGSTPSDAFGACDPYDPGNACAIGEKCSFFTDTCEPSSGSGEEDEQCTILNATPQQDDCGPGLICAFDDDGAPRCLVGCLPDQAPSTCDGGRACADWKGDGPEGVCFQECLLMAPDCAIGADGCFPEVQGSELVATCQPAGFGFEGDSCASANDCALGLTCVDESYLISCAAGTGRCCTPMCDNQGTACIGANLICEPMGVENQNSVGFCRT